MFTHTVLGTNDVAKSCRFYDAVMGALGYSGVVLPHGKVYSDGTSGLLVATPANGEPHTVSNGYTLGLKASDRAVVDAFHAAGLAHGGTDEGAPGVRPGSPGQMYGAYLRDLDGNKICAFALNAG